MINAMDPIIVVAATEAAAIAVHTQASSKHELRYLQNLAEEREDPEVKGSVKNDATQARISTPW